MKKKNALKNVAASVRDRLLKLSILVANDHGESFRAVEDGKAAAFLNNDVLHYGLISKAKRPADFAVVGKFFSIDPYAIMLRRDDPVLPFTVGTLAYWDATNKVATKTASGNKVIGKAVRAAADADTTVRIRMSQ